MGFAKGVGAGAWGLFTGAIDSVVGVGKASYYATGALLYATTGGQKYREQSETFHQAVASFKKVVENQGVIKTAAVNKINQIGETLASGDAEAIGELAGRSAFELASTLIPAAAAGKLGKAGAVMDSGNRG